MRLTVQGYSPGENYHTCRDEAGKVHRLDILVDGGLGKQDPEALVGRTVWCQSLTPYIEIANGVVFAEEGA